MLRSLPRKREPDERAENVRDTALELRGQRRDVTEAHRNLERRVTLPHLAERHVVTGLPTAPTRVHALGGIEHHRRRRAPQLPSKVRVAPSDAPDIRRDLFDE